MNRIKRLFALAVSFVLVFAFVPSTYAASNDKLGMPAVGSNGYQQMSISQEMLDVIKVLEGYSETAYWDNSQWSIGYGSCAGYGNEPDIKSVTVEEAEALLREQLAADYEKSVNDYCKKLGKQPTQNQYDALVDFTYNLGAGWMRGSRPDTWLRKPTSELDFVNAVGVWSHVNGDVVFGLSQRRIRDAVIFLRGEYSYPEKPNATHGVKSDLPVIKDGNLPYFCGVMYSTEIDPDVVYFNKGDVIGKLPKPKMDGYEFQGWKIVRVNGKKVSDGSMVTPDMRVNDNYEFAPQWRYIEPDPEPPQTSITLPFTDVTSDSWYYDDVAYVYVNGMMKGTAADMFAPGESMTRGMFVTTLYRLSDSPTVVTSNKFTDVSNNAYYADAITWAYENHITNGVSDTEFAPDRVLTRQDAVTFMHRYCIEYLGMSDISDSDLTDFADYKTVSKYAVSAMEWAVDNGLIKGMSSGDSILLGPIDVLVRAQCAALLHRLDANICV